MHESLHKLKVIFSVESDVSRGEPSGHRSRILCGRHASLLHVTTFNTDIHNQIVTI